MIKIQELQKCMVLLENEILNFYIDKNNNNDNNNNNNDNDNIFNNLKAKIIYFLDENKNTLREKIDFSPIIENNCYANIYDIRYSYFEDKYNYECKTDIKLEWYDNKNHKLIWGGTIDFVKKILNSNLYLYYYPSKSYKNDVYRLYTKKEENGEDVEDIEYGGEYVIEI
jgi:hypothetical protein